MCSRLCLTGCRGKHLHPVVATSKSYIPEETKSLLQFCACKHHLTQKRRRAQNAYKQSTCHPNECNKTVCPCRTNNNVCTHLTFGGFSCFRGKVKFDFLTSSWVFYFLHFNLTLSSATFVQDTGPILKISVQTFTGVFCFFVFFQGELSWHEWTSEPSLSNLLMRWV